MKEKSEFEKRTAEKQVSLLTEALTSAVDAKGHWLNASGKLYPKLYPKGFSVSPFNALVLALDSDAKGCKSNLFTQFSEAKARGESVREHEKGVPFLYYNWNKYVNRNNPDDVITKEAYAELSEQDKQQYKGVKNREIRVLFNIDQTLLPMANETAYTTALKKDGTVEDRGYGDKEDKQLHGCVNGFLQKMKDNLVNVRQDGTGVAHYDTEKDVIYLPRQRDFEHYNDYVQEMMRQLVSATGHQQRLAREGMVMKNGKAPSEDAVKKERLITEIASGVKMLELGLPARLSKDSLSMVDYWTRELKEDPCLIDAIESEVNGALKVLKKAELGEKVEYATDQHQRETAQIQVQLPNHYFVADEIKQHLNIEQDFKEDDNYINQLQEAATDAIELNCDVVLSDLEDENGNLPPAIRQAIMILVANFYNNRESVTSTSANIIPYSLQYLVDLYKDYSKKKSYDNYPVNPDNPDIDVPTLIEIIDNLNSHATDKALSANQGRVLKEMINDSDFITNEEISATYQTKEEAKQNKLTAGEGIAITNNVISVTLDTTVYEVVTELPTENIKENKIYLIASANQGEDNKYSEYLYENNQWEKLGEYQATIVFAPYKAGEGVTITNDNTINIDYVDCGFY